MKRRFAIGTLCALALALPATGQEKGKPGAEPQMSAEEKAAMEAMMKAMTPGAPHRHLAAAAGDWEFTGKFWTEPGAPPEQSRGTSHREMILGGRVMREEVQSEMLGMPFHGLGMTGYDNVTGRWWSTWSDSMSTGLLVSYGTCDDAMTRCEFKGAYPDPMTGGMKETRLVSESSPEREVMKSYEAGPDGKEVQTMELVFTRKKG